MRPLPIKDNSGVVPGQLSRARDRELGTRSVLTGNVTDHPPEADMSDENMADDIHQPTGDNEEQEDASPLDLQNAVDERTYDDMLDEGYSPPEKPLGVTKAGVTAAEQHEGESLDDRLRQEVPDVEAPTGDGIGDLPDGDGEPRDPEAGTGRAGRLVAPDEGTPRDSTEGLVAADEGVDGGAAGAEEAAVHVVPDEQLPPAD
jgi:hypothetical protein